MGVNTKLCTLSESAINAKKKPELVHKILALKGKVIVHSYIFKVVTDTSHDSCLEIELKDFEGCHCLPISRNSRDSNKRVITNLDNRKHPEALLQNKTTISSKDFSHLNVHGKVLFLFLLVLTTTSTSRVSPKTCKEEGKFIKSFAMVVLLQLKSPNLAMQDKYFMKVTF